MSVLFEAHFYVNDGVSNAFVEVGSEAEGLAKISEQFSETEGVPYMPLNSSSKTHRMRPGLKKPRKIAVEVNYTRALIDRLKLLEGVTKTFRIVEPVNGSDPATRNVFSGYIESMDREFEKGKDSVIKMSVQVDGEITVEDHS